MLVMVALRFIYYPLHYCTFALLHFMSGIKFAVEGIEMQYRRCTYGELLQIFCLRQHARSCSINWYCMFFTQMSLITDPV